MSQFNSGSGGTYSGTLPIRVDRTASGAQITVLDQSLRDEIKLRIKQDLQSARAAGVSDGEVLLALADGVHATSSFGIFCRLWGHAMDWFGARIVVIFSIFSTLFTLQWIARMGYGFVQFLSDVAGKAFGWLFPKSGESTVEQDGAASVEGQLALDMFLSFLPPIIRSAWNICAKALELKGMLPPEGSKVVAQSGGNPGSPAPGAMTGMPIASVGTSSPASGVGSQNIPSQVLAILQGVMSGSVPADADPQDVQAAADHLGVEADDIFAAGVSS